MDSQTRQRFAWRIVSLAGLVVGAVSGLSYALQALPTLDLVEFAMFIGGHVAILAAVRYEWATLMRVDPLHLHGMGRQLADLQREGRADGVVWGFVAFATLMELISLASLLGIQIGDSSVDSQALVTFWCSFVAVAAYPFQWHGTKPLLGGLATLAPQRPG